MANLSGSGRNRTGVLTLPQAALEQVDNISAPQETPVRTFSPEKTTAK